MQVTKRAKEIKHTIETAAVELGFPRRVSYARIAREAARYWPRRGANTQLVVQDRRRALAVASLFLLMDLARSLDRDLNRCARRTRKLVGAAVRAAA